MSRDDFFSDFDDEPSFPEDDSNILPDETPPDRPQRNTTFLIVAVALVIIFLLGLAGIAFAVISGQQGEGDRQTQVAIIKSTNDYVGTAIAGTATAKSYSPTPTPTDTPTDTPTSTATPLPSDTPTEVPTSTMDEALAMSQTADANSTATALAGGGIGTDTATPPEGIGGPVTATLSGVTPTATSTSLAQTGLFDDMAGGNASPGNLALFGFLALGLVGVIFGARRLRVKQ